MSKTENRSQNFSSCLSQLELNNYLHGNSSESEIRRVEEHISDCPLCSDALEAFMEFPESLSQTEIDEIISIGKQKNDSSTSQRSWWLVAASIALISISSYYIYTNFNTSDHTLVHSDETSSESPEKVIAPSEQIFDSDQAVNVEIEQAQPTPEQPKKEQANNSYPTDMAIVSEDVNSPPESKLLKIGQERENIDDLLESGVQKSTSNEVPATNNSDAEKISSQNSMVYYIEGQKVTDTKDKRTAVAATTVKESKSNTKSSGKTKVNEAVALDDVAISSEEIYQAILAEGLHWYRVRSYSKAIDAFQKILLQYPTDENAIFYSGLSHSKNQDFENAIPQLSFFRQNTSSVFYPEAMFELGMSFKLTGKTEEAKNTFESLVSFGGPYAVKAKNELNK